MLWDGRIYFGRMQGSEQLEEGLVHMQQAGYEDEHRIVMQLLQDSLFQNYQSQYHNCLTVSIPLKGD